MNIPDHHKSMDCRHNSIQTYNEVNGGPGRMWSCTVCRRRFYPACPECIDIGHRNETHVSYADDLREEFLRLLTTDSETKDRRRREFNQAIFNPQGWAIWSSTDLDMVMSKFDRAVNNLKKNEQTD